MRHIKVSNNRSKMATRAEKYWTKARMAKAKPVSLRKAPKGLLKKIQPDGKSRMVAGALPGGAKRQAADTVEVPDYSQYPLSCVGKLFMTEGNADMVGSAWVIGGKAIFSAAHCLFDDNGTFFDNVVFVPQYENGSAPLGSFAVVQMAVDQRYTDAGDDQLKFDLGIGILDQSIGEDTGVVSYQQFPSSQIAMGATVTGVGYPAGPPFDGSKMFGSKGSVVRTQATADGFFGAENQMTGGCSGGPWFDQSGVVVGLNSFVFVGEDPPVMHSPFFGQGFVDLIEWGNENDADIAVADDGIGGGTVDPGGDGSIKEELEAILKKLNGVIAKL